MRAQRYQVIEFGHLRPKNLFQEVEHEWHRHCPRAIGNEHQYPLPLQFCTGLCHDFSQLVDAEITLCHPHADRRDYSLYRHFRPHYNIAAASSFDESLLTISATISSGVPEISTTIAFL